MKQSEATLKQLVPLLLCPVAPTHQCPRHFPCHEHHTALHTACTHSTLQNTCTYSHCLLYIHTHVHIQKWLHLDREEKVLLHSLCSMEKLHRLSNSIYTAYQNNQLQNNSQLTTISTATDLDGSSKQASIGAQDWVSSHCCLLPTHQCPQTPSTVPNEWVSLSPLGL